MRKLFLASCLLLLFLFIMFTIHSPVVEGLLKAGGKPAPLKGGTFWPAIQVKGN